MELDRFFKVQIISPDGGTVYNITSEPGEPGIVYGSLNVNELLCNNELELGACNSNKLEVTIYNFNLDVSGYWILLYSINPVSQIARSITWFKGIIDSATTDNINTHRKIIAYDYLYTIRNRDVTEWYNNYIATHLQQVVTLKSLRDALCLSVGFTLDTSVPTLINDSLTLVRGGTASSVLPAPVLEKVTFGELLKSITEIQSCVPNVTRYGKITFIPIGTQTQASARDITSVYAKNSTEVEDYSITNFDGVLVITENSQVIVPMSLIFQDANVYEIKDNVFLNAADSRQIVNAITAVSTQLQNVSFSPATIDMVISEYGINLGELVKINNQRCTEQRCTITYHLIMSQTFKGPLLIDQTLKSLAYSRTFSGNGIIVLDPIPDGEVI